MPTFREENGSLTAVPLIEFATEKELQQLIEANLDPTFGCRFVASEFSTGAVHGGRIDTLALTDDGNPAIIEYKKVESASLINQALFYLDWIKDHRGDFELAAMKQLGNVEVNWSRIRVICLAPSYDNYALHAVGHMGAGIELWRYKRYANGTLELEDVYRPVGEKRKATATIATEAEVTETVKVEYTIADHLKRGSALTVSLFEQLHTAIEEIDASIICVPQKLYIAYKLARNFACVEIQKKKLIVTINRKAFDGMPGNFRDVSNMGHWGTGDVEVSISTSEDLKLAIEALRETYNLVGGD